MKIYEIEYYEVTCPDGGGMYTEAVAAFESFGDALAIADELTEKKNWPHAASSVPKRLTKCVFESAQEYRDAVDTSVIRKRALEKLSDIEKRALGL